MATIPKTAMIEPGGTDKQTDRESETDRERKTDRDRQRQTDRQTDRQRETDRERQTETDRQRQILQIISSADGLRTGMRQWWYEQPK